MAGREMLWNQTSPQVGNSRFRRKQHDRGSLRSGVRSRTRGVQPRFRTRRGDRRRRRRVRRRPPRRRPVGRPRRPQVRAAMDPRHDLSRVLLRQAGDRHGGTAARRAWRVRPGGPRHLVVAGVRRARQGGRDGGAPALPPGWAARVRPQSARLRGPRPGRDGGAARRSGAGVEAGLRARLPRADVRLAGRRDRPPPLRPYGRGVRPRRDRRAAAGSTCTSAPPTT